MKLAALAVLFGLIGAAIGDGEGFLPGIMFGVLVGVVLAVPPHAGDMQSDDPRLTLLEALRAVGYRGQTAVIIQGPDDAARMHVAGADLTLEPYPDAAVRQWARAIVAPHAGYVYSGRVAAAVYARVLAPETWVIIGPNHRGAGARQSRNTSMSKPSG